MPNLSPEQTAAVIARIRAAGEEAGSLRAWGRARGLGAAYVSDVLAERRPPSDAILAALGLRVVVVERNGSGDAG